MGIMEFIAHAHWLSVFMLKMPLEFREVLCKQVTFDLQLEPSDPCVSDDSHFAPSIVPIPCDLHVNAHTDQRVQGGFGCLFGQDAPMPSCTTWGQVASSVDNSEDTLEGQTVRMVQVGRSLDVP